MEAVLVDEEESAKERNRDSLLKPRDEVET